MPHATESLNLPNAPSPIPIPGLTNSYVRTSTSPYDPNTATSTNNMSDYVVTTEDGVNYDQFICTNFSTDDAPSVSLQPEGRNMETYYYCDYRCCNEEINNIHDFLQHVDTKHPGLYVNSTYGIMSLDANAVYSQSRLPAIPVYSMMPTVTSTSALHDLKIAEDNRVNSNHISKHKSFVEDTTYDKDLLLTYHIYPLRDPSVTATTFLSGQTSGPSISASYEDDDPSVLGTLNHSPFHSDNDPLLSMMPSPPLSLSSCPTTPVFLQSTVPSPLDLENVGIPACIPISISENSASTALGQGQVASSSPHTDCGTNANDQRRVSSPNTGSESPNVPLNRQPSYGSYISTYPSGSGVTTPSVENSNQDRRASLKSIKKQSMTHGSLTIPNEKLIPSPSATEHNGRRDSTSSSSSRTVDPNTLANRQKSSTYFSSTAAENLTVENNAYVNVSTFVPSTTTTTTPNYLQKPTSPTSMLPSNATSTAFMTTTKISPDQVRGPPHALGSVPLRPHAKVTSSIDGATLTSYVPSVSTTPYSMNPVDGYPLVEYIPSGQTSPSSVMAKYQRIQPKTGISVSMADVYADPSLGCSTGSSQGNKNSKKRGVSSSAESNKQIKRRASKSSEKSFEAPPVSVITDESVGLTSREDADKYPHKCTVVGCPKAYKNANGLKYHNEHGHVPQSSNGAREKPWSCRLPDCQKAYGSKGGLNYHIHHVHPNDLWALP